MFIANKLIFPLCVNRGPTSQHVDCDTKCATEPLCVCVQ